ncbi:MAG TPA: hypothetical protein DCY53_02715 [Desulfobacteraceae bacterium]|nr:hypothetical protein [Desulfobacteraceae bacterium]
MCYFHFSLSSLYRSFPFFIGRLFFTSCLKKFGNQACENVLSKILLMNLFWRLYSIISNIYKKSTCQKDNHEFIKIDSSFF